MAILHQDRCDFAAANEVIEDLADRAEALDDDYWRASALECAATRNFDLGRFSDARAGFVLAATVKERLGDTAGQGVSTAEAARAAALAGDLADVVAQLAKASKITRSSGNLRAMARVATCTAVAAQIRRDFATWRLSANEALKLTRSIGDRGGEAAMHTALGALAQQLWSVEEAREQYQRAAELFEGLKMPGCLSEALALAGDLATELGLLDEAELLVERAAGLAETSSAARILVWCKQNTASIAALRGDFSLAIRTSREALAKQVSQREAAEFMVTIASAQLSLGRFEASIKTLEEALPVLRRYEISNAVLDGTIDLARAYLAAARGDEAKRCAETLLRETVDAGDAFPRILRPRILWIAGRAFEAVGERGRAQPLLDRARAALEELSLAIPDAKTRGCFLALPLNREIAASA